MSHFSFDSIHSGLGGRAKRVRTVGGGAPFAMPPLPSLTGLRSADHLGLCRTLVLDMVKLGLAWRFETQVVCFDHKEKHQVDVLMGWWGRGGEVLESFFFSFVCFRDRVSISL